jgi:hypothetical protein
MRPPKTAEYTLRAMADNYGDGPHIWDHLDAEACREAANELHGLRAILWPPCPMCGGRGYVPDDPEGAPIMGCENCGGSGHVASALSLIEAERDKLREALKPFAQVPSGVSQIEITIRWGADDTLPRTFDLSLNDFDRARAALHPTDNDRGARTPAVDAETPKGTEE